MEKEIKLFNIRPTGMMLCRIDGLKGKFNVFIESITKEQEERIDKSELYKGNKEYIRADGTIINGNSIYMYGEVDLSNDDDLDIIEKFNLVDDNSIIYSNFNYDKGIATTVDYKIKTYNTWNPIKWFTYCHCLIGKPKRIIVYKVRSKHIR